MPALCHGSGMFAACGCANMPEPWHSAGMFARPQPTCTIQILIPAFCMQVSTNVGFLQSRAHIEVWFALIYEVKRLYAF